VWESVKIYTERIERPRNFLSNDTEKETKRRILVEQQIRAQELVSMMRDQMEQGVENQLKQQKEAQVKASQAATRERQKEELDQNSLRLREYLSANLVDFLTEGLVEVCCKQPEDPIDTLAEFLFKRSLDVACPDPSVFESFDEV